MLKSMQNVKEAKAMSGEFELKCHPNSKSYFDFNRQFGDFEPAV
jgi:hypothetical protein